MGGVRSVKEKDKPSFHGRTPVNDYHIFQESRGEIHRESRFNRTVGAHFSPPWGGFFLELYRCVFERIENAKRKSTCKSLVLGPMKLSQTLD